MKNNILLFLFSVLLFSSCSVDQCDVDCNSGPLLLDFEVVAKTSGENLFTNGVFIPEDIQVIDLDNDNALVEFNFISENKVNIIRLGPFGWNIKTANYLVKIENTRIFKLKISAEEVTEGCCSFVKVTELKISDADFELEEQTGIYKIFVE